MEPEGGKNFKEDAARRPYEMRTENLLSDLIMWNSGV